MYRTTNKVQKKAENFDLLFGGQLSPENRWVKLAQLIPWDDFEAEYASQFSSKMGAPAKTFRMALGALMIKERLGTSDEETVEQIRENLYLQYFLGLPGFTNQAPFDPSMLVHFRKRISRELLGKMNEQIVLNSQKAATEAEKGKEEQEIEASKTEEGESKERKNQGKLILDATCAPADINYPTDLKLLNQAREQTEKLIDQLYEQVREQFDQKPRTYRRIARKDYLELAKQRRPKKKKLRKAIRKQLSYLRRNLAHIDALVAVGASLSELNQQSYRSLLIVSELFRQQQWMYQNQTNRIDDRIVSLTQPHLRPMVRGKAGIPVEFECGGRCFASSLSNHAVGAKLSVSYSDGYCFLDHLRSR